MLQTDYLKLTQYEGPDLVDLVQQYNSDMRKIDAAASANAQYSLKAGSAAEADHALTADSAVNAGHASTADSAAKASHADTAASAARADNARHAASADTAGSASTADSAVKAANADYAVRASNADHAISAGNAESLAGISGQPVARYTHAKSGTVHVLTGPANAKYLCFAATGDYLGGDTWTLNGVSITVAYSDGQIVAPTDVLSGDAIMGAVDGNYLRLMNEKPPQGENLLDNWYFADPINQRAQNEYPNGYTIDRWLISTSPDDFSNIRLKVHDGYVEFINNGSGTAVFRQRFERLPAGVYTISVITDMGLESGTVKWEGTGASNLIGTSFGQMGVGIVGEFCISLFTSSGKSPKFYAAKLELGSRQTLAHQDASGSWVLNDPPPNKALELAKCQRYYLALGNPRGVAGATSLGGGYAAFLIPTPVTMRANPTVLYTDATIRATKADYAADSVTLARLSPNGVVIQIVATGMEAHGQETCAFYGSGFAFSADL